jgi:GTP pyrophosphokinase
MAGIKRELEDLSLKAIDPEAYADLVDRIQARRGEREAFLESVREKLESGLKAAGIKAELKGRPKHFFSIYNKIKSGRDFDSIYDLFGLRIIAHTRNDCYRALGVVHDLYTPVAERFKDYIAMPKFNHYQALHTTVIGPEGRPLEIQIRTRKMHYTAEFGVAAHWIYKDVGKSSRRDARVAAPNGQGNGAPETEEAGLAAKPAWLRHLLDWQQELQDPKEFMETLKIDLFEDEVFVFTPRGEVKSLAGGSTPLDFAYAVHTDVGHRCVGAKVNGKITPLHYQLQSGDIVEILTSKSERGPSRDWLSLVRTTRARNKIRAWFTRERREDAEHRGRELLQETLRKQGLPAQKITGSPLLAVVIRVMGVR